MLREQYFIGKMDWLYICIFFVKWTRNIGINSFIRWEIKSIIDIFFNINTIVLSCIFFININILYSSNISSLLYLTKKNIIKSRSSIKWSNLFNRQHMLFRYWVNNNISSFFENLLINFVVSVIINNFLRFHSLFREGKSNKSWFSEVILRVIKVRSWLHLWKFKRFWSWFSIDSSSRFILNFLP